MIETRWHRPGLFVPILLITIGVGLLLANLGLLRIGWWDLWRLWPLLLILLGLDILSRSSRWATAAVTVVTLALISGVFYLLVTRPEPLAPYLSAEAGSQVDRVTYPLTKNLGRAQQVTVDIHMGLGNLHVDALQDSAHLVEGSLDYPRRWGAPPYVSYAVSNGRGRLVLRSQSRWAWIAPFSSQPNSEDWTIGLSREVPLSIELDAGASSSTLDLSHLQVTDLRVKAGVGRMDILFPAEGKDMTARLEGGVGELVLRIPESLAAHIRVNGGLGNKELAERFVQVEDDVYETNGYASAENRVEIRVDGGLGTLRVQ